MPQYHYASPGSYFVTICTNRRRPLFGEVMDDRVMLNDAGNVVQEEWRKSELVRPDVELGVFEVMPNHVHGIITITGDEVRATQRVARDASVEDVARTTPIRFRTGDQRATQRVAPTLQPGSIGAIVGQFKSEATKRVLKLVGPCVKPIWQRNYYEHVIRDDDEMEAICAYIAANPSLWQFDRDNLQRLQHHVKHTRRLLAERRLSEKQLSLIAKLERRGDPAGRPRDYPGD